jgi:hypothetical protein
MMVPDKFAEKWNALPDDANETATNRFASAREESSAIA